MALQWCETYEISFGGKKLSSREGNNKKLISQTVQSTFIHLNYLYFIIYEA